MGLAWADLGLTLGRLWTYFGPEMILTLPRISPGLSGGGLWLTLGRLRADLEATWLTLKRLVADLWLTLGWLGANLGPTWG